MVVSTSGRSQNVGDSAEPQWEKMLARLVLGTCSGWVFHFCYFFMYLVHWTLVHWTSTPWIPHESSFTGTAPLSLCLFRNLISIRELVLILGTVMLSRSSLDSQQLPGWFVWDIILTQSPRLFLWIHVDSQSFAQDTSLPWLYSLFLPFHVFPGSFLYCPKSTKGHSSYFEENL